MARARAALGLDTVGATMLLRVSAREIQIHNYESDRPYHPFLNFVFDHESTFDPANGAERDSTTLVFNGLGEQPPTVTVAVGNDRATFIRRDTAWLQSDGAWRATEAYRTLDPWIVVRSWASAHDAHVVARCRFRDYDRTVLERQGMYGPERLYLDPKTGYPVKVDRQEPHYLWGQQHVEYIYATWLRFSGPVMPATAARLVDGDEEIVREVSGARLIPRGAVETVVVPDTTVRAAITVAGFLRPTPIDTVRLGPHTFALLNPGYNGLVTLSRDTVLVLDATQSEMRARADSAWIGRLFPGHHPVAVIVTDLAWPHVAGVRFWVASGATIVSRDISEPFLRSLVVRPWKAPDKLERSRGHATWRFVPVRDSLDVAGLSLYPIDGIGSEGALLAYLRSDRVLWASDYVQTTDAPAQYTSEVYAAACRAGIRPERGLAEHTPPFAWSTVANLARQLPLAYAGPGCRGDG
jgi:hypothetical protein